MLDFIQYEAVATTIVVLLSICGALVLIGNAAAVVSKVFKPKHDFEEHFERVDKCLAKDNERIADLETANKLTLRALTQLITHEIDGNHVDKLREVRDEIEEYLIQK